MWSSRRFSAPNPAKIITMSQSLAINSDYKRSLLQALELFRGVRPDDVQDLLQRCDRRDLAAGELLLSPGAKNYVIGAEDTHLLVIHQSILWEMVDASHDFAKNLLIVLSERVRSHNKVIADSYGELRKFERHATTDALTGLGNRHSMEESFPREIARCEKDDEPVTLVMIDVDNFKDFNDKFGHIAGDRALAAVSRILRKQFRPRDVLVRYGGDEFAVLLPQVGEEIAMTIANRVRAAVSGNTGDGSDSLITIPVRLSMGVAEKHPNTTLDNLIRAADAALYRAKHAGRDMVSN
jgi:diguanylate cyclase (GGDEF)-like protein